MRTKIVIPIAVVAAVAWPAVGLAGGTHNHADHDPALCHELHIGLGGSSGFGPIGPPIMRPGKFPVVVRFLTRGYGIKCGNGLRIFVDMALAHRNENVNSDEYCWDLDLSALNEGLHYILVNACDHNDHIGVASVVINVRKSRLPGLGNGKKIGIPLPPGGGLGGALPALRSQAAPPAFDTDLQPSAIACCGDYGDWPVAADCKTMVPVPEEEETSDESPSSGDF